MHRLLPFPTKKFLKKKNVTLDPRHGTLALDMEPSTLDPRQKDRLYISLYKGVPPHPPPRPGPLINVIKGFCRLTKIFQAFLILEGILEL